MTGKKEALREGQGRQQNKGEGEILEMKEYNEQRGAGR